MLSNLKIPVCGFVAFSGTGKTTLLEKVIPLLKAKGIRIGLIKHAHHDFDIDYEGKDSYRLRKAGAKQTLVASAKRWALINEEEAEKQDPDLNELIGQLSQDELDIILVEGFKYVAFPRIELHRSSLKKPLLFPDDNSIIAIACDGQLEQTPGIPELDINKPEEIVDFVMNHILKTRENS